MLFGLSVLNKRLKLGLDLWCVKGQGPRSDFVYCHLFCGLVKPAKMSRCNCRCILQIWWDISLEIKPHRINKTDVCVCVREEPCEYTFSLYTHVYNQFYTPFVSVWTLTGLNGHREELIDINGQLRVPRQPLYKQVFVSLNINSSQWAVNKKTMEHLFHIYKGNSMKSGKKWAGK